MIQITLNLLELNCNFPVKNTSSVYANDGNNVQKFSRKARKYQCIGSRLFISRSLVCRYASAKYTLER